MYSKKSWLSCVHISKMNVKFQEITMLEGALQEQQEINESLRDAQGDVSAYEAELEAQLRDRDAEANQQKEELERLKQLSQVRTELLCCQRDNRPWDEGRPNFPLYHISNIDLQIIVGLGVPPNGRWYQFARFYNFALKQGTDHLGTL